MSSGHDASFPSAGEASSSAGKLPALFERLSYPGGMLSPYGGSVSPYHEVLSPPFGGSSPPGHVFPYPYGVILPYADIVSADADTVSPSVDVTSPSVDVVSAPYDVSWTNGDSFPWSDELSSPSVVIALPSVVMTLPSAEMKTAAANAYASVRICAHLSAFFLQVFTLEPLLSHSQGLDPAAKNKYVMSFKQQALGGFSKESDEAVLVRGKAVLLAMTDNPNFVTPEPALETVTEILDDYDQKLAMAKRRGSPEDTAAKNDARKATEQMLKRLAFYVTQTADGSLPKLLSSGFPVSSLPQKD